MTWLVSAWYGWLAQLSQGPIVSIQAWIDAFPLPVVSAVLFGLIGATSPCQLTTNLGALAFSARQSTKTGPVTAALAYVSGKIAVYSLVGGLVVVLGVQLQAASIPVVVVARKLLGPLMLIVGLSMLFPIPLRGSFGQGWSQRWRARLPAGSRGGGFLLGVAFSFAFCPTLFWLFFGLTIPLALRSPGGWSFPALFALGTALPLLAVAGAVSLGLGAAEGLAGGMARARAVVGWVAGIVFVLAGLHDTFVYWWL